VKRKREG